MPVLSRLRPLAQGLSHYYAAPMAYRHKAATLSFHGAQSNRASSSEVGKLPKLPVPEGAATLESFLRFSRAISEPAEFLDSARAVSTFESGDMPKLQQLLKERAASMTNWLTPWWLNVAYLEARDPLPVVTSPGVLFPKFEYCGLNGQIEHAAKITQAALFFFNAIQRNQLKQDKAGGSPMDMSQYRYLFGTNRVPKKGKDEIRYGCNAGVQARHIAVMRNGHIFTMAVFDKNGDVLPLNILIKQFEEVVHASEHRCLHPLSVATAENRDNWAGLRESVARLPENKKSLEGVETSLFVVALDGESPPLKGYSERDEQARQCLHGSGTSRNSINRWFDKTIQFIVGDNGYCGMCYEHTPAEGPPVAALMDFVMDQFDQKTFIDEGNNLSVEHLHQLQFELTADHKVAIDKACARIDKVADDLEVISYTYTRFGKNFPKKMKVSPDSFIQTAFALAFYRIHGTFAPTYETASLRKFDEGRTENIRNPNHILSEFLFLMAKGIHRPFEDIYHTLMEALRFHKDYSQQCMAGSGVDRHILAWRLLASENGMQPPAICDTASYKRMMHFQVSTSQVPTRHFIQMCFGPSADDCYGICYNPQEKELHFTISTFNKIPSMSSRKFARELEKALNDLRAILAKGLKEQSKL